MRLLNSQTGELKLFLSDHGIPPYAILSHTWGEGEVSFQEMASAAARLKQGFGKIKHVCKQSQRDGIAWVWVDTCCIDKTSSAELSEAINSMFTWYKNSAVCYAYLSDVVDISSPERLSQQFRASRWFTRGWTLQELLAPSTVRFYSANFDFLGTREDLSRDIVDVTKIEDEFLRGRDLQHASIAKRMSWAALRQTTRTEDIAYCLLGIFDVNMPLLYGEGKKAFLRLQEEIMKSTSDYSLFAWGVTDRRWSCGGGGASEPEDRNERGAHLFDSWVEEEDVRPLKGILAASPRDFADSGSIVPHKAFLKKVVAKTQPPAVSQGGVRIQLPTLKDWWKCAYWWDGPRFMQPRTGFVAVLGCKIGENGVYSIGIPFVGWGDGKVGRRDTLVVVSNEAYGPLLLRNVTPRLRDMFASPEMRPELRAGDIIFREVDWRESGCRGLKFANFDYFSLGSDYNAEERLLRPRVMQESATRLFASLWTRDGTTTDDWGIAVVFGKVEADVELERRPLYVGFVERHAKYVKGGGSIFKGALKGNLVAEQLLQTPTGQATWRCKHGPDVVDVTVVSERVTFEEGRGQGIWVDLVDVRMSTVRGAGREV